LPGWIEADHGIGETGADLPGKERGRGKVIGFCIQSNCALAQVRLQLVLHQREVYPVCIDQLLVDGQALVLHRLVDEPQQADRRHQHRQQQQQHQPRAARAARADAELFAKGFHVLTPQSQRDWIVQPRVARHERPWDQPSREPPTL
jgi:hypothetical protein